MRKRVILERRAKSIKGKPSMKQDSELKNRKLLPNLIERMVPERHLDFGLIWASELLTLFSSSTCDPSKVWVYYIYMMAINWAKQLSTTPVSLCLVITTFCNISDQTATYHFMTSSRVYANIWDRGAPTAQLVWDPHLWRGGCWFVSKGGSFILHPLKSREMPRLGTKQVLGKVPTRG